jgi:hypothetical protein
MMFKPWPLGLIYVARDCLRTQFMILPIRIKDNFLFGFVKVARIVKSGKQYLSCDGLRAYCVGKHGVLETLLCQG